MQILLPLLAFAAAGALAYFLTPNQAQKEEQGNRALEAAKEEAAQIKQQSKKQVEHIQKLLADERKDAKERLAHLENQLSQKEDILKRRENRNKGYQGNLKGMEKSIQDSYDKAKELLHTMVEELAKIAKVSPEDALKESKAHLEEIITGNKEAREKAYLEELEEEAAREAKAVLQPAIQRMTTISSVDKNSTAVPVRDDRFKGMLIGKGGNNVAFLESLLPVSIIFNLDPSSIHVGGVNLIRRHIASRAIRKLQKLVKKKRLKAITHDMIKKAVEESDAQIMDICDQKGVKALKEMHIDPSNLDPEIINYTGRLYFRTSYGQNILQHSLEMAHLARLIAEAIGANEQVAMEAAFFHDLGKAIDHDIGGSHDDISKEILDKHNYDERIVYAAYAHHDKVPCEAPEDFIVKAVDAISGGRPGARQESVTNYFERMKQLQDTAASFEGVKKVFTMSAGREVRVFVQEQKIKDQSMQELADGIAEKISDDLSFPGIIKVNLIRQTKASDTARELKRR